MKFLKPLFFLSILIFIISCTKKDESTPNEEQEEIPTSRVYKKTELIDYDISYVVQEVFYENSRIKKLVFNKDNFWVIRTYVVTYQGNEIESILETGDYTDPALNDYEILMQISKTENKYILESQTYPTTLEITYSGEYINSTKVYVSSDPSSIYYEENFMRNSQDQLVSSTTEGITYTYSDYDSNKEQNPLGNVYFSEFQEYIYLLNLKFSSDTPTKAIETQGSYSQEIDVALEYDSEGYVTKATYSINNSPPSQYIHSYVTE